MQWRTRILSGPTKQAPGTASVESEANEPAEVFARIYRENHWGKRWGRKFFSGPGSHDVQIVEPYVRSVREFLGEFPRSPDVVDLGCGDFHVGRQLRSLCGRYVACDIVPELIRHNAAVFARQNVEFMSLNIIDEPLPVGDVVFLRQVLQHLSNAQITRVLSKLRQYCFLVVTEHLPADAAFVPNLDHPFGSGIRVSRGSGVVLTAPPFDLNAPSQRELCRVQHGGSVIKTIAYGLT